MLSSIHPLGERGRNNRFSITATAHIVGAAVGGALFGLVPGLAGWIILDEPSPAIFAAAVIAAAVLLDVLSVPLPSTHRQVNEHWLDTYRGTVYGAGFGFQLGLGVVTIVPTWLVPATIVVAALTGSWSAGLAIGVTFGIARGVMLLTVGRIDTIEGLQRYHRRLHERQTLIRVVALGLATATAVAAGAIG